jgi:hypothetical protein
LAESPSRVCSPSDVELDPGRGLAVIDVDEVLALFVQGFDRFLRLHGFELRMASFALFGNIYPIGAAEPAVSADALRLFKDFFAVGCGGLEPAPGAAAGLRKLSAFTQVVILTNAPEPARALRGAWLKTHEMDYPMILSEGLKGPPVATLAARVAGPVMFVDDLLSNLDSVEADAPQVARFQMIADPSLRRLAPTRPERHRLVAHWEELVDVSAPLFAR